MYNGQIKQKINEIFDTESKDSQDAFISDLRKSLSETHEKFNKTATTLLLLIGAHFLSTSGVDETVRVFGIDLPEGDIFQSAVLLVTSIVFLALSCLSYLKKYQRECYILSLMKRYPGINSTGFHELRLPSNALLGADMLRYEDDFWENKTGVFSWITLSYAHFTLPFMYIIYFSITAMVQAEIPQNILVVVLSFLSIVVCLYSYGTLRFQGKIE